MDRSPCCWDKEIGEVSFCPCDTCVLEELAELPFASEIPCPIEYHDKQLESMITACNRAYSVVLRMESILVTRPGLVSARLVPKIIKRYILLASLKVYDACFENYMGPSECTCELRYPAMQALKRLHDVCVLAGYSPEIIWSFLTHLPAPIHTVLY